jgi:hypothetical protein
LLLILLAQNENMTAIFADIYLYEVLGLLIMAVNYMSFDLFLTRNWINIVTYADSLAKWYALYNLLTSFVILSLIYALLQHVPLAVINKDYLYLAILTQMLINIGRVNFVILRMQNNLMKLFYITLIGQLILWSIFVYLYFFHTTVSVVIVYFLSFGASSIVHLISILMAPTQRTILTRPDLLNLLRGFLLRNWYTEISSTLISTFERLFFISFFTSSDVGLLAFIQKALQPFDALSRLFKLVQIHKIVSLAGVKRASFKDYQIVYQWYVIILICLWLIAPSIIHHLTKLDVSLYQWYFVCLIYLLYVNSIYITFKFFRESSFGLFVLCDIVGLLVIIVSQTFLEVNLHIYMVFALKLFVTILVRLYVSRYRI